MNNFTAMTEAQRQELIRHNRAKVNAITPQFLKESTPGVKKHLQREIDSAKIAIAALTADGWIKCSERMPGVFDAVITSDGKSVNICLAEASAKYRYFTSILSGREVEVSHWMPLPPPPETSNEQ